MAKDNDALDQMRKRYRMATEACQEQYDQALEDIKFVTVPGNQWDATLRARRRSRPMYEFPKLRMLCQQIINEQKQARPQGKVRGVEETDKGLAEIMQGLCRNIESTSNAEQAYDIAFENAVRGGMGVFRITTDYASQDDFDLDIRVKPVRNPFAAKFDPAAVEIDRRDGEFAFLEELIPESEFKRRFPKADTEGFFDSDDTLDFRERGQIKVAEYWYKKREKRVLWRLSNGVQTFADESPLTPEELAQVGVQVVKTREVESHKVCMRLTNGKEFLTDVVEFPSKFIPLVPVWGNIDNIEGEDYFSGAVRYSKDSQRLHNLHKTAMAEAVAKAPKAPYITTPEAINGFEAQWGKANAEDYPYLLVNEGHTPPQRSQAAEVPQALILLANSDNDDMRSQTGQYAANLGAPSNEASGRAINARKMQGATATFNYLDNLVYAIKYAYEILVDMIPKVYDTPRVVRILGDDGGTKWKELYQEVQDPMTGQMVVLNDIAKGKYDVTVTVGPAYATQRMEAVEGFSQLAGQLGNADPEIAALLAYQVVNNMDLPGTDDVVQAMRKKLVASGALKPQEGEEPPPPPGPPPALMVKQAEMEQQSQLKQLELQQQAQIKQMELAAEAEQAMAKLRQEAEIAAARIQSQERIKAAEIEAEARLASTEPERQTAQAASEGVQIMAQAAAAMIEAAQTVVQGAAAPRVMRVVGPSGQVYTGSSAPVGGNN